MNKVVEYSFVPLTTRSMLMMMGLGLGLVCWSCVVFGLESVHKCV